MIIFGAILVVLVGGYAFIVAKAARMNRDPLQQELAALILELFERGRPDQDAMDIFWVSVSARFARTLIDPREEQTRLAHALSMVRANLGPEQYNIAKVIIRAAV